MDFENSFSVDAPIDAVWRHLLDIPSVAPCVPGAKITETTGPNEYRGTIRVKLGAIRVSYDGTLTVREADEAAHRLVLAGTGNEARGSGSVSATITMTLTVVESSRTAVEMTTAVTVTGRMAQMGRGIMQDVSSKMIDDFAHCLETRLAHPAGSEAAPQPAADALLAVAGTGESGPEGDDGGPAGVEEPHTIPEAPTPPIGHGSYGAPEMSALPLLFTVIRGRTAAGLKALAHLVDPERKKNR